MFSKIFFFEDVTGVSFKSVKTKIFVLRNFVISAGTILAVTGLAKIWSGFGKSEILRVADPLFGVEYRYLIPVVGVVEIFVAVLCFSPKSRKFALGLVALLASNFLFYRLGLLWVGYHKPCPCLGNLTDALPISPRTADIAMKIVLAYLLIGSYASILLLWRRERISRRVLPPQPFDSEGKPALQ